MSDAPNNPGRDQRGRFGAGNPGGKGGPHRRAAELRRAAEEAVTPEHVAECIVRGIRDDRYLVYTSPDIRLGHFLQDTFSWPYEVAMRFLNDRLHGVGTSLR